MVVRVGIVLTLTAIMWGLTAIVDAHGSLGAFGLLAFGFVVLFANTFGELFHVIKMPHVVAYLLTGYLFGPHGVVVVLSADVISLLEFFNILAVALIAMDAGACLDVRGLKRTGKVVGTVSVAIIGMSFAIGLAYAGTAGQLLPFIDTTDMNQTLAVGLLLGVLVMATSPPVTLAVVNESDAKGSFTETVLSTVIINNIQVVLLLAIVLAVAGQLVGVGASSFTDVMGALGAAVALGAIVSALVGLAFRYLKQDALLILVALCFVGSYFAGQVEAEALLVFLAAGIFIRNASSEGVAFQSVARTLSGPVYVVFFTLVGASLHVDELMHSAPFAVALVLLRLGGFWISIQGSGRLVDIEDSVGRFGFLGLAPQAGIALVVAEKVGDTFPGWGAEFASLGLAAIALNEMVGPILLKISLGLAGETGDQRARRQAPDPAVDPTEEVAVTTLPALPEWLPDEGAPKADPWGAPPNTGHRRLDEHCRDVLSNLHGLVRDLRSGPVATRRDGGHHFLSLLRKEFLRTHRRTIVRLTEDANDPSLLRDFLSGQRADLATRWKGHLLGRAQSADFRGEENAVEAIITQVDRMVDELPLGLSAPLEKRHVEAHDDDSPLMKLAKLQARMGMWASPEPSRTVEARELARYHLKGFTPTTLADVTGLLTIAERHLLARARSLFESYEAAITTILKQDPTTYSEALESLRSEMEEEFAVASREVDRLADETVRVASYALGRPYRAFLDDLDIVGTPALPPRKYRYSRVHDSSEKSMRDLKDGLSAAREITLGTAAALAMELELLRLSHEVASVTYENAAMVGRDIRGKLALQMNRVDEAMAEALIGCLNALEETQAEVALLQIRDAMAPLDRINAEAVTIADGFRASLQVASPFQLLLTKLSTAIDRLTDYYSAVFHANLQGRGLPSSPNVEEIPFRELVRTYLESEVGRGLRELAEQLESDVDGIARAIDDIDRMLNFNGELARSELEVLGEVEVPEDVLEVVKDMTVGTLERTQGRVVELRQQANALADQTEHAVREGTAERLLVLRDQLAAGQLTDLRARLAQRSFAEGRRELRGAVGDAARFVSNLAGLARTTVGEEALLQARRAVGLQEVPHDWIGTGALQETGKRVTIPAAYRRLFTDPSLEAGDLLMGREAGVAAMRNTLCGEGRGATRAGAIIGNHNGELSAVVQALCRGVGDRAKVIRNELHGPVDDEQLAVIVEQARKAPEGTVITLEGLHWLFALRPNGFGALRTLISTVLDTSDRVGWLVSASNHVWAFTNRLIPMTGVFPQVLTLEPMDADTLRARVLARHAMSGYGVQYRRPGGGLAVSLRQALASNYEREHMFEDAFFRALHRDSGGVLGDALRIWLSAIAAVDQGHDVVTIGEPPFPARLAIEELSVDTLLTLRQVARQGTLRPEDHAVWFQWPPAESAAHLGRLRHFGLLERDGDGTFCVPEHLSVALVGVLNAKGFSA